VAASGDRDMSDAAPSRAIACFTFDNMGEAADIGAGRLAGPLPPGEERSLAIGYPRLVAMLERRRVRATFFLEGWNGEHHPDAVADLVRRGQEVGMHGWLHERWSELAPEREADLARRATESLERAAGVRPRGFRAPGGSRSASTAAILADLGYAYDASLGDGARPSRLDRGLTQIPFVWPGVDGFHYLADDPPAPATVRDGWLAALDKAASRGGLFVLICHAFLTGTDEARSAALEAVIEAAVADPRVDVLSAGEAADRLATVAGAE
jgi:peptidoglycan/xylan/chitin deacetylase (PgdA/CDA1 family)